jgi:SAM-dependent methyltransferase
LDLRELQHALEEIIFVGQAHKLRIFKELYGNSDTAEGLADRMNFDRRVTWVLLEALVEMKYLDKSGSEYSVTNDVYQRLVDEKGINYEGDFWQFLLYLIDPWRTLPHVLKHGEPDQSSYEKFSIDDFIRAMDSPWKKRLAPEIVDACLKYCADARIAVDIGGAPGTIAREFASRGIKTIIYDLPESVDVMYEELSHVENIEILKGDATDSLPDGAYDIAFLGNLCHGQSPEDNARILKMCYSRLRDGGIVVIFDNVRNESYLGARLALHMITQSPKGNVYTREEYYDWLEDVGFRDIGNEELSDRGWQLIVAYR